MSPVDIIQKRLNLLKLHLILEEVREGLETDEKKLDFLAFI